MKHKRHQKDRRDKDERPHRYKDEDHRYSSTELNANKSSEYSSVYKMKDTSDNFDENSSHPKKLIIYIVKSLFV